MGNDTKCRLCSSELWLRDEHAGNIIEELRVCKKCLIKRYESRIFDAEKHPRNCFFIGVKQQSEEMIKYLKNL